MPKPIMASPPIEEIAECWAERARAAYCRGDTSWALECARKAVAAHERFGNSEAIEPQAIAACRLLIKQYHIPLDTTQ
jgi:hypothetical protein